ncbi:MAG: hypothetical protein K8T90_12025 [Planctomycetes bacterium]|nr:hypothetical protein [Planctomycetota bacterium]
MTVKIDNDAGEYVLLHLTHREAATLARDLVSTVPVPNKEWILGDALGALDDSSKWRVITGATKPDATQGDARAG